MGVTIYSSADTGAPTLQGIVGGAYSSGWADGSLLELLRKCLVTGYGSKSAAGWSLAYSGTSEGMFQQGSGCGFYLHVLDDGTATAGAKEAIFNGYEQATAYDTGTYAFPTSSQNLGKLYFRKSDSADTVQRPWLLIGDDKTFYLWSVPQYGNAGSPAIYAAGMGFGDFYSVYPNDAYNCLVIGRITSASSDSAAYETLDLANYGMTSGVNGHYMARGYAGIGTSVNLTLAANLFQYITGNTALASTGPLPYPNPSDSKLWMQRIYVGDPTTPPTQHVRGYLRGLWQSLHRGDQLPYNYTWNGSGGIAGRTFKVLGQPGPVTNSRYIVETSDTWD